MIDSVLWVLLDIKYWFIFFALFYFLDSGIFDGFIEGLTGESLDEWSRRFGDWMRWW